MNRRISSTDLSASPRHAVGLTMSKVSFLELRPELKIARPVALARDQHGVTISAYRSGCQ